MVDWNLGCSRNIWNWCDTKTEAESLINEHNIIFPIFKKRRHQLFKVKKNLMKKFYNFIFKISNANECLHKNILFLS
jgi:hypothetical protein